MSYENHGMTKTREYQSWINLRARTLNKNNKDYEVYKNYPPCEAIKESFTYFLEIVGMRPDPTYSIDRKDNTKGYWCGVCNECLQNNWVSNLRWATKTQQVLNRGNLRQRPYPNGVYYNKKRDTYIARCTVSRKSIWLGEYKELSDAIEARNKGAKQYYKELI